MLCPWPCGLPTAIYSVSQVYVLKRPYVDEFLRRMGELFECVLFTASLAKVPDCRRGRRQGRASPEPRLKLLLLFQYADPVTDLLDRCGVFRARLFREACVFHQGCYVKDLSRLGRDLRKTVILDNSPASYIFHPENAVSARIRDWGGCRLGPWALSEESTTPVWPSSLQWHWKGKEISDNVTFSCPRCLCSPGLMTWQIQSC